MLDFLFGNKKKKSKESKQITPTNNPIHTDMNVNKFILDTFLTLTSKTYPYGFEDDLVSEMTKIGLFPSDLQKDAHGNYFYKIGESRTMFTSHFDTACKDSKTVNHVISKNYIKTDGTTILGADDKAGVTIMLYMIKNNIPGLYYFFVGEEVGCVGSGLAAKYLKFKGIYDRCISFDRRDTFSVITHQSSSRCCSDDFAVQLAKELNKNGMKYKKDDSGVYTDSAEFTSEIPECTNLSVGYYKEHTTDESQDIEHLSELAKACLLVNWESLVTKRDPSKIEYKSWSFGSTYGGKSYGASYNSRSGSNWRDRDYDYGWGSNSSDLKKTYGYHDDFYNEDEKRGTRRGKKNKKKETKNNPTKGRTFYSSGSELIPVDNDSPVSFVDGKFGHKTNVYEWVKFKYLDDNLSKAELEIIKDQYFNMDDPDDRRFYEIIQSYVVQLR
jgi:hypothetical protein